MVEVAWAASPRAATENMRNQANLVALVELDADERGKIAHIRRF
jgi:hypothetical protein